jgi:adenylate kinase
MRPSKKFIGGINEDGEEEEVDFEWHCKNGLQENIQKVKAEFCDKRKLKPFKTMITGPPCSGKSHYGDQLAKHFNVPHIHVKKLIEEIEQWGSEKEADIKMRNEEKHKKRAEELRILVEAEEDRQKRIAARDERRKQKRKEMSGEEEEAEAE